MKRKLLVLQVVAVIAAGTVADAAAQEPRLPAGVTQQAIGANAQQILERLRQSGLTREQVRDRLRAAGYETGLADRYFDALASADSVGAGTSTRTLGEITRSLPAPSGSLLAALRTIGLLETDSVRTREPRADTLRRVTRRADEDVEGVPVFGRDLFAATMQFDPLVSGPVDAGYRLGPGDELTLIVTGDVELAYQLQVTREGYIVVPDVGQVVVNGLTLAEARGRLNDRLARVYSGMETGTTQADVTVGKLRSKLVYVIGQVEVPSAHALAGSATVFNAMYRAGGPAVNGSFRNIEVRRGNRVIARVDLYDYLLRGDKSGDVMLEQGDVVFVPVVGPQVTVMGAVRRPAVYELREGDGIASVLQYAGGFESNAFAGRVQIDRVLPPSQRRPGVDRVLVDVELDRSASGGATLQNGDIVRVFSIGEERRHRVVITGAVRRPGVYEWQPGSTLGQLIDRASGLQESAYVERALVYRFDERNGTRTLLRVGLDRPLAEDTALTLMDRDSIVVFDRMRLASSDTVAVEGQVRQPGAYALAAGMSVKDLLLEAGGFRPGARTSTVEVARMVRGEERGDTTALVFTVPVGTAEAAPDGNGQSPPAWRPEAAEFLLQPGDRVVVRRAPGYEEPRSVRITGQVMLPGTYVLRNRQERITDLVERAGGLTSEGYREGMQLWRAGTLLAIDVHRALSRPRSSANVALEAGDSLHVPQFDPTVLVRGAVGFESRVLYQDGRSLDYYISQAGGFAENADRRRTSVAYPNGERETSGRFLLWRNTPRIRAGSTIYVPARPENADAGFDWDTFLTRTLTIMSTTATLILAISQIDRN